MASQNKIVELIGAIKTIYSYYAKDTDVSLLVKTWSMLLRDYDDKLVDVALYKCLQSCKMPPTPADIIEVIGSMQKSLEPSNEDLWSQFSGEIRKAARLVTRFGYNYVDASGISQGDQARNEVEAIWNGLPETLKRHCGSKGEFVRMAVAYNTEMDFLTWEKQRFMKNMPIIQKRQEYTSLFLDAENRSLLTGGDAIERKGLLGKSMDT